jgi:hypothetical protein
MRKRYYTFTAKRWLEESEVFASYAKRHHFCFDVEPDEISDLVRVLINKKHHKKMESWK